MTNLHLRKSIGRSPWRRGYLLLALALGCFGISPAAQAIDPGFDLFATVPLPANANGSVGVNEELNKIYTSGGASSGQDVVVIDGKTFATTVVSPGSGANVDVKTDRYWAANVFGGGVIVRDGTTNGTIMTISLGFCPINTTHDFAKNRVWVGAQCGPGNDPVFAINANPPFNIIAGPISSGGVMGPIIANGANGRLYLVASGVSERVNPTTFAVTTNAFGSVMAIQAPTNRLYAFDGANLQIINGAPDPEVILTTIPLPYTPVSMGINTELNHLYLVNSSGNSIEVRSGSTGALLKTFSLGTLGVMATGNTAVDSIRGRIYVIGSDGSGPTLLVIEDLTTARKTKSNRGG